MVEFPTVTYEVPEYLNQLDDIFARLLKYETDYSPELVEIRKQQIRKHSYGHSIADILNDLANLIGQAETPHTDIIMEHSHKMLVELHSPVIFNVPINLEPFHKWETWSFNELLDKYTCLALSKGWEDYYTLPKDFSKNKRIGKYGLEYFDIDYDSIKNYHILDMLSDLILNDYLICGYELRSFMDMDENNKLLKTFNKDSLIEVKLKEKYTPEKCRVSRYYPPSAYGKTGIKYIARLDGENPVIVLNESRNYPQKYVFQKALNLFEIIELFKKNIPQSEDWYIAYKSGFDFDENLRNRNIRKYTKGMVYQILLRLAHHGIINCFSWSDIIINSWDGEIMSYQRPYKTIHVCNNRIDYVDINRMDLNDKHSRNSFIQI